MKKVLFFIMSLCVAWQVQASQTIKLIVPFSAGGNADLVARAISDGLSKELGQPVVVENRAGAGGAIATRDMAAAKPDGLTLGLSTVSTFGSNHVFFDNPLYHPIDDFEHIITVAATPKVMIVRPDFPATDIKGVIAELQKNPGRYSYGSAGRSVDELYGESFKILSKTNIKLVPYKGGAQAIVDFLGGHTEIMFDNMPLVLPYVRDGKAKLVAISWPTRLPEFPNVPTWAELGYTEISASTWYGLVAPRGLPTDQVNRINQATHKVLKDPKVIEMLSKSGAVVVADSPAQSKKLATETFQRLSKIGQDLGIKKNTVK